MVVPTNQTPQLYENGNVTQDVVGRTIFLVDCPRPAVAAVLVALMFELEKIRQRKLLASA